MKIIYQTSFLLLLAAMLASCSQQLSPFTDNVYTDLNKSSEALSKVQFYLSSDIVLYRDYGQSQTRVENGAIKLVDGRKIEEVIFKKGTPGVFVFSPKKDRIAVSFESNDDNYLMFGPNDKVGGRFVLLAKQWNKRRGIVTYAGSEWKTTAESAYANLMVDLDKARKTNFKKKTVSGRRI